MKGRAPPARSMRVNQRPDARLDPGAPQGLDHEPAFPVAVERLGHMLRGAAAAAVEPGTEGLGALRTRLKDLDQLHAPPLETDTRALARQRAGDGRAAIGDATPMRVERDDPEVVSHAAPRSGIPSLRRRRGSERE